MSIHQLIAVARCTRIVVLAILDRLGCIAQALLVATAVGGFVCGAAYLLAPATVTAAFFVPFCGVLIPWWSIITLDVVAEATGRA